MKVLLMDLDIHRRRRPFPNLALMKLSAHHKARGDEVFLNFPLQKADIVYASCVFTWNAKHKSKVAPGTTIGGSGIDLKSELPADVESLMPDYGLYPKINFSLGFTSRGCIRRCPWCIVPEKEGGIKPATRIYDFWDRRHRNIVLMDNNLLASPNWKQVMEDLIAEELEVDFNQGLDIRLLDDEKIEYLKRVKAKELRFAFDDMAQEKSVRQGIERLTEAGVPSRRLSFYVLVGFDRDRSALERMKILHSLNVDVYPMIYQGPDGKGPKPDAISSLRAIWDWLQIDGLFWHGNRQNIRKFLRVVGRLPE